MNNIFITKSQFWFWECSKGILIMIRLSRFPSFSPLSLSLSLSFFLPLYFLSPFLSTAYQPCYIINGHFYSKCFSPLIKHVPRTQWHQHYCNAMLTVKCSLNHLNLQWKIPTIIMYSLYTVECTPQCACYCMCVCACIMQSLMSLCDCVCLWLCKISWETANCCFDKLLCGHSLLRLCMCVCIRVLDTVCYCVCCWDHRARKRILSVFVCR